MNGLMMDWPLVIPNILRRAAQFFSEKEIVSRWDDGTRHRMTYGELEGRVHRLMNALRGLGIQPGDRVATCAWNHHRHLELYFAVPSLGAVLHTINFRLSHEQLRYIINHAQDRLIFVDRSVAGTLAALEPDLPAVEKYVLMDDRGPDPAALPRPAVDYEELLTDASDRAEFPPLHEEMAAGMCYTSATTGDPKGALYSHRSTYLHAMAAGLSDVMGLRERDRMLPIVPMFHVNAWGFPFLAPLVGADLIMPMELLDPASVIDLCERERVTYSAGVPTVWMAVRDMLR